MSAEGWVAAATLTLAIVAAVLGLAAKALIMFTDSRIRKHLDKAAATYLLGQRAIALNQEANGQAIARIAGKIDNGVNKRLERVEAGIDSLTRHLLDE